MQAQEEKEASPGCGRDSPGTQHGAGTGNPHRVLEQLMGESMEGGSPAILGHPLLLCLETQPKGLGNTTASPVPELAKGKGWGSDVCIACTGQSLQPFSRVLLPGW